MPKSLKKRVEELEEKVKQLENRPFFSPPHVIIIPAPAPPPVLYPPYSLPTIIWGPPIQPMQLPYVGDPIGSPSTTVAPFGNIDPLYSVHGIC